MIESIKGKLLVALPALRDPNFDRTVVFMLEHGDEGAFGVVVNRPHPLAVGELLPRWKDVLHGAVHVGGPVAQEAAICLARARADVPGTTPVADGIVAVDLEADPDVVAPGIAEARVFVGSAGWGPGQLESELDEHAWVVLDALPDDVFDPNPADQWRAVFARQPMPLRMVASFPDDPRLN